MIDKSEPSSKICHVYGYLNSELTQTIENLKCQIAEKT